MRPTLPLPFLTSPRDLPREVEGDRRHPQCCVVDIAPDGAEQAECTLSAHFTERPCRSTTSPGWRSRYSSGPQPCWLEKARSSPAVAGASKTQEEQTHWPVGKLSLPPAPLASEQVPPLLCSRQGAQSRTGATECPRLSQAEFQAETWVLGSIQETKTLAGFFMAL